MPRAQASHILVKTQAECENLKKELAGGADFAALAKKHSQCPSGARGGALGEFGPGQMVPEFDQVVFSAPVGAVQGPVKTQFGYHLVLVTKRA
jgi:peptidyl-prolyl cis-trans isomerase C